MLDRLSEHWGLQLAEPYAGSHVSYVVRAYRGEDRLVLEFQWPHDECVHEAETLRVWNGDGAVYLVDHDDRNQALLLERCSPGPHLAAAELPDPLGVLIGLLPRLWKPVGRPFSALSDEAEVWQSNPHRRWEMASRPCERHLIDAARRYLVELKDTQDEQVRVHQDLHGDNVLAANREPWPRVSTAITPSIIARRLDGLCGRGN